MTNSTKNLQLFKATCSRSANGNLTRIFSDGTRVTVFKQYGRYRLSIVEPDHARYYPLGAYATQDEAVDALLALLDWSGAIGEGSSRVKKPLKARWPTSKANAPHALTDASDKP